MLAQRFRLYPMDREIFFLTDLEQTVVLLGKHDKERKFFTTVFFT